MNKPTMQLLSYIYIFFNALHGYQAFATALKIKIEPDANVVTKFIGDSVNFTCFINKENGVENNELSPLDVSNILLYTVNWNLPTNAQERVTIIEEKDKVSVHIKNLTEADHGNYTCILITDNNSSIKKSSVYLAILPRGILSSCNPKSFYCDKTLCIANRYECDGVPDCPDGQDEANCGPDHCSKKLTCDDGRCLSPQECCLEPSKSPPNCTIHANIRCCRQLIHPALLDQDLYYLASRRNVKKEMWYYHTTSSLLIGAFVLLMTFVTIGLVMSIRFRFCRPYSPPSSGWSRPPPWSMCNPQRLMTLSQHPTDQYLLQSSNGSLFDRPEYIRRIPGLRSDLLSPNVLSRTSQEGSTIVLVPLSHSALNVTNCGPPPSYQQVIDGPPPPYSSERESLNQGLDAPLLSPHSLFSNNNNNNNGDINGNMTPHLPVAQNRNFPNPSSFSPDPSSTSSSSSFPTNSTHVSSNLYSPSSHSGPSGYGFLHNQK